MDLTIPASVASAEKKLYTGTAARLLKLLGSGCTQEEASRACGVDPSYTSQLMKETSFIEQVNAIVTQTMHDQSQIDENYTQLEKNMSEKLLKLSEYVFDPDKALRIAKFANEAKRAIPKGQIGVSGTANGTTLQPVILIMPQHAAQEFVLNPNNEIVGVNGKELMTLPSANITKLTQNRKNGEIKKLEINGARQTDPWSDL
jgi:hypothetical protein